MPSQYHILMVVIDEYAVVFCPQLCLGILRWFTNLQYASVESEPSCQMNLCSVFEGLFREDSLIDLGTKLVSTFSVARALVLELSTVVIFPLGVFSLRGCGKQRQQPAVWHLTSSGSPLGCPHCASGKGQGATCPWFPGPTSAYS